MRGVVAEHQVIFGGAGETLTIRHDTVGSEAYEAGILLAVRAAATTTGVVVGLDKLIDLGIAEPDGEPPRPTVREV
jgi:4-hydroxy-tetrahydrodipicolinate reductase